MNLKVLEGLKQLQRNIGKQTDINEDKGIDALYNIAEEMYKDNVIDINKYKDSTN